MHFLLFGTGDYYNRFKKWFPRENVLALLDLKLRGENLSPRSADRR